MLYVTPEDVYTVYMQLKDKHPVYITNTTALNEAIAAGFSIECPILVGKAHGQIIWLYAYEDIFILDVFKPKVPTGIPTT